MTMEFLFSPATWPFTASIVVLLGLLVVELFGLGLSALELDFADLDHDGHPDNVLLDWLGLGTLPVMVLLAIQLAVFGIMGLAFQNFITFPLLIAVPVVGVASLPVTAVVSHYLAKIWPQDESTAVSLDDLIGKRATVISTTATKGASGEATIRDQFGQTHYISIEPHGDTELRKGDVVLVVAREGQVFTGVDPTGGFRPTS